MKKFIASFDLHYGWERKNGHKVPLHDEKALNCMLSFAQDFKPDVFIWGGDAIDCGSVSHHNHGKPGATEGLKLREDVKDGRKAFIEPVEKIVGKDGKLVYIVGNHEDWLTDLTDSIPALEGLLDVNTLLRLEKWQIVPQGGIFQLGKLCFMHGDQLKGGENCAKAGVIAYEKSIRFGHFHSYSAYSKTSALDYKFGHTGVSVPCLCGKQPRYSQGSPNRWMQGFNFGYVNADGSFSDYVPIIVDGKTIVNGKVYKG